MIGFFLSRLSKLSNHLSLRKNGHNLVVKELKPLRLLSSAHLGFSFSMVLPGVGWHCCLPHVLLLGWSGIHFVVHLSYFADFGHFKA